MKQQHSSQETIEIMQETNVLQTIVEVAADYSSIEKSSCLEEQRKCLQIAANIMCVASSVEEYHSWREVLQSKEFVRVQVELLRKSRLDTNVDAVKTLFNICVDDPTKVDYICSNQMFW